MVANINVLGVASKTEHTKVCRNDEPGPGGACHKYLVTSPDCKMLFAAVDFQNGPVGVTGSVPGCQNEDLLKIVIDRLQCFEAGPLACDHNHFALGFVQKALDCLDARTADRKERGVEGRNKA